MAKLKLTCNTKADVSKHKRKAVTGRLLSKWFCCRFLGGYFIFGVPFPFQSQLVFIRHPGNLLGLKAERDEYASKGDRTSHERTVSFG